MRAGAWSADIGPLKIAIVGAGQWGQQHARVFASRADTDLCAVAARHPEHAHARAAEWGIRGYTSIPGMIEAEGPDLVSVCLPNEEHFDATMQVIETGVPLITEKPLVFDLAQADELLAAADRESLFFAINFNHRFAEPVLRARSAIGSGDVGDVIFATWRFGGEPGNSDHPYANLIETQCHGLDMLEYLCGPLESVMSQMTGKGGRGYGTVAVALAFGDGAVGTLLGSYDTSYAYPGAHLLEVNGTRGRLIVEDTVRRFTLSRIGEETRQVWEPGYFNDAGRAFHHTFDRHVDAVLAALRAGAPPPVPASAGRRALQLAYSIIESFEAGRRVPVPDPR